MVLELPSELQTWSISFPALSSDSSSVCISQFWHFTVSSYHPLGPFCISWAFPQLGWTQLVSTPLVLESSALRGGRDTQLGKRSVEKRTPGPTGRSFCPCSFCRGIILGQNEFWRWNQNFRGSYLAENESGFRLGAILGCMEFWRWNPISAMGSWMIMTPQKGFLWHVEASDKLCLSLGYL